MPETSAARSFFSLPREAWGRDERSSLFLLPPPLWGGWLAEREAVSEAGGGTSASASMNISLAESPPPGTRSLRSRCATLPTLRGGGITAPPAALSHAVIASASEAIQLSYPVPRWIASSQDAPRNDGL